MRGSVSGAKGAKVVNLVFSSEGPPNENIVVFQHELASNGWNVPPQGGQTADKDMTVAFSGFGWAGNAVFRIDGQNTEVSIELRD